MLIATAGHVNHGKTSLIRALTGVDTDRLPEEKRRGLSIDLGFAYAQRADGGRIGFVDVPGHERFLANMISGVLPLDHVMLVVAADEGPARQTVEHLTLLDAGGIPHLVGVVSKIDRADSETIARAEARLRDAMHRTSFADARFFRVSAETGEGIAELKQHLESLSLGNGNEEAGFRLPIDRAFTLAGAGVVVTGTVLSGTVRTGDALILTPGGIGARVRSLHAQDRPAAQASAGVRCAVAIAGPRVEKSRIRRGDMLVAPSLHAPAERIGVELKRIHGASLRNGEMLQFHYGSGHTAVRMRLIAMQDDQATILAELTPEHPIPVLYGDRFVLRNDAAGLSVAGGIVIDPDPPGRSVARAMVAQRLKALSLRAHGDALAALSDAMGFVEFEKFCRARNLGTRTAQSLAAGFVRPRTDAGAFAVIFSSGAREAAQRRLVDGVARHHLEHPEVLGPKRAQVLCYVGKQFPTAVARVCLAEAIAENVLVADGACIRLPSHRPHLTPEDQQLWERLHPLLRAPRPPHIGAIAQALGSQSKEMAQRLIRFEQFGLLTRIARNRFVLPDAVDNFRAVADELMRETAGEGFTAAQFNRKSGIGRNLAIEVLEFLDANGVTKRHGSHRRML